MATVQLANIDDQLYEALVVRAAQENRSVSQEVVAIVREHLIPTSRDAEEANKAFMELVGTWQDSRTAEEIIEDIRSSRQPGNRFNVDAHVFD
jgi:plasmid stability protein